MRTLEERFARFVTPSDEDSCWEWEGYCRQAGLRALPYGMLKVFRGGGIARPEYAHRIAFFLAAGYWPEHALHTCDNPKCVNPNHLYDGSQRQNMQDASERGRLEFARHTKGGRKGEWIAPLPPRDVTVIRRLYNEGWTQRIASAFGITQGGVSSIVRGRTRVAV
jgi:hypothetical protein